jgi:hypothetical protein
MKNSIYWLLLLMPFIVNAQNHPQFDQQQMQAMMQNAQQMQACMENVDQSELQRFEQQAKQMEAEVNALCDAGERDQAQHKALSFGQTVASSAAIQEVRNCAEIMRDVMPGIADMAKNYSAENSESHVCDN